MSTQKSTSKAIANGNRQAQKAVSRPPLENVQNDVDTNENRGRRLRKASEKELARRQEEGEQVSRRAARTLAAQKKAKQAQREADTEAGVDVSDETEDDEPRAVRYSFTSQSVKSRHDILAARTSKVPPLQNLTEDEDQDEDEDEDDNRLINSPQSRPSSPFPGDKRPRSPSDSGDIRHPSTEKVRKITDNKGRPKAGDYDELTRDVLVDAISVFRCFISSECAFPDHAQERIFAQRAWREGCRLAGVSESPITPSIAKLLAARASHLRGELKTKARPIVKGGYGFENGQDKKTIKANRTLAEDLKERIGFAYTAIYDDDKQLLEHRKGLYRNKNIQTVINDMFFANRRDEGVGFPEYFNPITIPCLALILTALECAIDEWATGIKTDVSFSTADYKSVYEGHIKCLEEFAEHTKQHKLLPRILQTLHDNGRFHSGAQPLAKTDGLMLNTQDFEDAIMEAEDETATEDEDEDEDDGHDN